MIVFSSLQLRRGTHLLLDNASATINPGQKIGLTGKNGCGKSSLLALLKSDISADSGSISLPAHWRIAFVDQNTPALKTPAIDYVIDGDRSYRLLEQELEQASQRNDGNAIARIHGKLDETSAWSIQARAASLLHGLGFCHEQIHLPVCNFSGGWRMRLNLAQALLCPSDLLLLDEPTNHLDLDAVIWLEKWLKNYPGTLILISHDRDFLDSLAEKIIHIEQQTLTEYTGNYSDFERQRATRLAQQQALYLCQQKKVAHLQNYIDRFRAKASKARQAQSRLKMLQRMELITAAHADNPFQFHFFAPEKLPVPLLHMENVSAGYDQHRVLNAIKLSLVPGSRIGLLGRNGAGKSTLIKLLAGELAPVSGHLQLARGVTTGYFAQHQLEYLRADETPLQHLTRQDGCRHTGQQLRDYLSGFGFRADKVNETTAHFSGGEKARLVLALLVWQRPNLLLLDEPTNHLDLDMRQALTEALIEFEGALVVVSHDRHLLRATTDELYLADNGNVQPFAGDLEDYQRWMTSEKITAPLPEQKPPLHSTQTRKQQKREQAQQRQTTLPLRNALAKLEQQLEQLSAQLTQAESQLTDPDLYQPERKNELNNCLQHQAQLRTTLQQCEQNWLETQQQLEELTQRL